MTTSTRKSRLQTGIKITNPLRLPVRVRLISKTGALHIGTHYAASRNIMPNETLTVNTKGKCDVDIKVEILRFDETGRANKVGDGGFIKKSSGPLVGKESEPRTEEVKAEPKVKKREESEEPELRSLGDMIEELRKQEEEVKA